MNKIKLTILAAVMSAGFTSSFAQTSLYAGDVRWNNGDQFTTIDTTGGAYTPTQTALSTDYAGGTVDGIYGMSLNPADDVMYVAYQTTDGDETSRRLGTIDVATAAITDIGMSGNLTEISFGPDGVLYGSLGSVAATNDYEFVSIDLSTAAITGIFVPTSANYGSSVAFDWLNDEMIWSDRTSFQTIDIAGTSSTAVTTTSHPGETNAILFLDDNTSLHAHWGSFYDYNRTTMTFTASTITSLSESYHAMAFGASICNTVDNSTTLTGETISANYAGASYQWVDCNNSNAPISGATDADFTAATNGNYAVEVTKGACVVTSECVNINSLVGVNEIANTTNSIYPNPNNGRFTVSNTETIVSVSVIDITGKVIFTESNINSNNKEINLDNVNAGVYFVKTITNSNNEVFSKVTVK